MKELFLELINKRIYIATAIIFMMVAINSRAFFQIEFFNNISIISSVIVISFIGIIFLFFGSIEWKLERNNTPINTKLKWIHFLTTFSLIICFLISAILEGSFRESSKVISGADNSSHQIIMTILLIGLLTSQFIFLYAILKALFSKG